MRAASVANQCHTDGRSRDHTKSDQIAHGVGVRIALGAMRIIRTAFLRYFILPANRRALATIVGPKGLRARPRPNQGRIQRERFEVKNRPSREGATSASSRDLLGAHSFARSAKSSFCRPGSRSIVSKNP
jgi:hypothetical protein